jgi:hypothetical protein
MKIADDFGFSGLLLNYRLSASRYETPKEEFKPLKFLLAETRRKQK